MADAGQSCRLAALLAALLRFFLEDSPLFCFFLGSCLISRFIILGFCQDSPFFCLWIIFYLPSILLIASTFCWAKPDAFFYSGFACPCLGGCLLLGAVVLGGGWNSAGLPVGWFFAGASTVVLSAGLACGRFCRLGFFLGGSEVVQNPVGEVEHLLQDG